MKTNALKKSLEFSLAKRRPFSCACSLLLLGLSITALSWPDGIKPDPVLKALLQQGWQPLQQWPECVRTFGFYEIEYRPSTRSFATDQDQFFTEIYHSRTGSVLALKQLPIDTQTMDPECHKIQHPKDIQEIQ